MQTFGPLHNDMPSCSYHTAMRPALCYMLFLAILTLFLAQVLPAEAGVRECKLKSFDGFGKTIVDIVPNAPASTIGKVEYECTSPVKFSKVLFCTTIQAAGSIPLNKNANNFYLEDGAGSNLAWQMTLAGTEQTKVNPTGSSGSTAGWLHINNSWSQSKQNTTATQKLYLTYRDRQHQKYVRSGDYTTSYQMVTRYKFNDDNLSSCDQGISKPDGEIITPFHVEANVPKNCQFENFQDIDFHKIGGSDVASARLGTIQAVGKIGIRCTYETPYSISANDGNNAQNGIAHMKNGEHFLPYKLLQEGCSVPWSKTNIISGKGAPVNTINYHEVCAQIITPLATIPAAGPYTDTVIVTATF